MEWDTLYLDSKVTTKYYHLDLNYNAINIVRTSKLYFKNFNNNNLFKVNILSTLLSSIKTKTNLSLILTTYII